MQSLAALADPIRREVVDLLAGGELAAGDVASRFPVSRPAISRHLRVLREAGLVRVRTEGRQRFYALDPGPLRELDGWLERYRDLWAHRLDALDTEIARGRRGRGTESAHERARGGRGSTRRHQGRGPTAGNGWSSAGSWPDPIDDVWSALTEPERLARWIGRYEGERAARWTGRLLHDHGRGRAHRSPGDDRRGVAAAPSGGRDGRPGGGKPGGWSWTWPRRTATRCCVFRSGASRPAPTSPTSPVGWHWYLDKLDAEVSGRPGPADWETFWAEVGPGYRPV